MNTQRLLKRPVGKKSLFTVTILVLLFTAFLSRIAVSAANDADKQKVVRQVAQKWMQIGTEQYDRGLFKAAEQSLLRARDYQEHLSTAEQDKLAKLIDKTHTAVVQRDTILQHIQAADMLIKQNQLAEAKASLEAIADAELLTKEEQKLVAVRLQSINNQLNVTPPVQIPDKKIEMPPVAAVNAMKADDNGLDAIEEELTGTADKLAPKRETVSQETKIAVVSEPVPAQALEQTSEEGYLDTVNRKRSLVRSHTEAVVSDAAARAQTYMSKGDFVNAKEVILVAERTVAQNQMQLGDNLYEQYNSQLKQITNTIAQRENANEQQIAEQKRITAAQTQREYRDRTESDRSSRVSELMDNALAFQKQQRYEEALGQLESLLAIEPLNNQALIFKQTLEDMINFRRQLEIQKESHDERLATLMKAEESSIPFAEELTYPKNWRELVANRKPDEAIGQDPVSAAVYKQLEKVVDLGQLTPEMSFGEAIDILKNAVEPPLKMFVSWRDLYDNADIDRTTPINMDAMQSISLGTAMELLLKSVSGGFVRLGYTVENGVVKIATAEELGSKLETLVYDVSDLLGRPADFYAQSSADVSADIETAGGRGFEEETRDRQQLLDEATRRAQALMVLIQETVVPDTWYDAGGEGTIRIYENKKLIIHQTREVHKKVELLLKDVRKSLGHQVAIEARFLVVGENFLEDIGMNVRFNQKGRLGATRIYSEDPEFQEVFGPEVLGVDEEGEPVLQKHLYPVENSGKFRDIEAVVDSSKFGFDQVHGGHTIPLDSGISGSWPKLLLAPGTAERTIVPGLAMEFGTTILDTLQVDFLLRATQAHRDAKSLTAPRVSVLNGESASLRVQRVTFYPSQFQFNIEEIGTQGASLWTLEYEDRAYVTGTLLNITPTITTDKKNVLLNIVTELRDFLGFADYTVTGPFIKAEGGQAQWNISYPDTEISRVETRVSVPDGGTLLLGGQKLTSETDLESGVPILSKIPVIGRLFSNRSKVKDEKILLILVKPTIILQEEGEARAMAGS